MDMMTCWFGLGLLTLCAIAVAASLPPLKQEYQERQRRVDQWYAPARFGLFYTWGLATGSLGSWKDNEHPLAYNTVEEFEAAAGDPETVAANMVAAVKQAGARYLIFTVFHSCGRYFVTYPSKVPGYRWKATQDYFGALVNRCHDEGIPLIAYMGPDSFHAFTTDGPHMTEEMRDQENVFAAVTEMINEIIDLHGERIGGFWFDGYYRASLGDLVHARLPRGVVIHNNESGWGLTPSVDFGTTEFLSGPADPEYSRPTGLVKQHQQFHMKNPIRDFNEDIPEAGGWWYQGREDAFYQALPYVKDPTYLVKEMVSSLGQRRQWNFALGIGPLIDGTLPACFAPMIENIGHFLAWAGEAIYDTMGGEGAALNPGWFNDGAYGSVTVSRQDPCCHYILVTTAPSSDELMVQNNGYQVASVTDLRSGTPVEFSDGGLLSLRHLDWNDVSEFGAKVFKVTLKARQTPAGETSPNPGGSESAERPKAGRRIEAWTVATEDTILTVGATDEGQMAIYELSNPAAAWNWTAEPSVLPLVKTAAVGDTARDIRWKFKEGNLDQGDGRKATLCFVSEEPALELTSEWWARPGRGPVRHAMRITNRSKGPVEVFEPPTMQLDLAAGEADGELAMWTFHSDGLIPDTTGVYRDVVRPPFLRQVRTTPEGEFIPYAVFDAGGKQGVYVGVEWGYCRIAGEAQQGWPAGSFRVRGGEFDGFSVVVGPGETFEAPPGFVGAYKGDVDDAGNGLRRYLFNYSMPEVVRKDVTYPKVQWNAFLATGDEWGSWNCVERKYYPLVDAIAPLGFEEVAIDVGWWKGEVRAPEPEADPVDWPSGMAKAAAHAHNAGMRFVLYWNKGEAMASADGRQRRMMHIKRLYDEHKADMWRSDSTGGPVVGASYAEFHGFYAMLDQLYREMPNFQWENCVCGGQVKDFGTMRYAVRVFNSDHYSELQNRQAFYDTSYMFPPAQIEGHYSNRDQALTGSLVHAFRSCSMGAPDWFIDNPNGGNGGKPWAQEEKDAVKAAVATYKQNIRPLVRNADLYHILPRPDGKNWDGIQYYDTATKKGVVYLFKPSAVAETITLKLRGLDAAASYRVTFEDGSNPEVSKTGEELANGLAVTLKGAPVSELVWIERQ